MPSIPQIQIRTTPARLSIDADLGLQDIRQPKAKIQMDTSLPLIEIRRGRGELSIDQSRAWAALGRESILEVNRRIRDESIQIFLRGIARTAQYGDRMAAIHTGEDAIVAIAEEKWGYSAPVYILPPAAYDNVDIYYIHHPAQFHFREGRVDMEVEPQKPQIEYHRKKVNIRIVQYPKVEIIPPKIDLRL